MVPAKRIRVRNVNYPGQVKLLDAKPYEAMKSAFLKVLSKASPGLTEGEILKRLRPHLPAELFPMGRRAGWWAKTVQLDLEARHIVLREKTRPLRWHKAR